MNDEDHKLKLNCLVKLRNNETFIRNKKARNKSNSPIKLYSALMVRAVTGKCSILNTYAECETEPHVLCSLWFSRFSTKAINLCVILLT